MEPIRSYSKEHQLRNYGKAAAVAAAVRETAKHQYVTVKTQLKQTTPLKPGKAMKPKGKRGKRMAPGDNAISEKFRTMKCLCGCRADGTSFVLEFPTGERIRLAGACAYADCNNGAQIYAEVIV